MTEPEQALIESIAKAHGVTPADIIGPGRAVPIWNARREAIIRLHREFGMNYGQIGKMLGGRDRKTVWAVVERHGAKLGYARPRPNRRQFTDAEFAIAREMSERGTGKAPIARRLKTSLETLRREFEKRGVELRAAKRGCHGTPTSDPLSDAPIGSIPPGHPMYEIDQLMFRARNTRPVAVGGWRQSGLADIV